MHVRTEALTLALCRFAESPKLLAVSQETKRAEPELISVDVDETSGAPKAPTSPDINMESKGKRPRGDRDGSAVRELLLFHVAVVFHLSVSF